MNSSIQSSSLTMHCNTISFIHSKYLHSAHTGLLQQRRHVDFFKCRALCCP